MKRFQPPGDDLLQQTAELRASGQSWEQVALVVHRTPRTLQSWPIRYARRWQIAYAKAERLLHSEAAAEAIRVLRKDLRSEDDKAHRAAADTILKHQRRPASRKTPAARNRSQSSRALAIATYIEGLSDAQIETLLQQLSNDSPQIEGESAASPSSEASPADAD